MSKPNWNRRLSEVLQMISVLLYQWSAIICLFLWSPFLTWWSSQHEFMRACTNTWFPIIESLIVRLWALWVLYELESSSWPLLIYLMSFLCYCSECVLYLITNFNLQSSRRMKYTNIILLQVPLTWQSQAQKVGKYFCSNYANYYFGYILW